MQSRTCIYVFKLILTVCHHYTATLEMDYLQLALQLLEHWELMVGCHNFNHLSCYSFINVLISRQKSLFLMFVFPGLDWKVFSSSCLPKKFRENVTFSGTTYKVSGIPDGKIKALWGFDCIPTALDPTIQAFHSKLWNTIAYSIIQSHMRTF